MKKITVCPEDDSQKVFDGITEPTEIFLKNGVYRQKLVLSKPDITLKGESREGAIISYGDYAKKIHADGREYNTFRTYTLCITGENTRLENLTVENCAPPPRIGGQCVALHVACKRFSAVNADFKSTQDTIFLAPFPKDPIIKGWELVPPEQLSLEGECVHVFKDCKIYGTVDFIFGCSEAFFKDCDIISLESKNGGYIAAPAHSLDRKIGFCFVDCRLLDGGAGSGVYLARPWRDYGACAFVNCVTDGHLDGRLVNKWNDTSRDKTARFSYYDLKGFNGNAEPWAKKLTADEADAIVARCDKRLTECGLK